ncbi:hypothetical protein LTR62_007981 [Meristemomyces frigidus]|uniref:Uncharacterized protein n=1 Tax=Meristemomyces frigidus TaxID=1508187 RepID=A0AAN7TN56_9PEZI|nr:hypothetical protein LTR62_007981 [Meristemomyces frigidus]
MPAREYHDLSRRDLRDLGAILAVCLTDVDHIQHLIAALPQRLRSKYPLLSSFCSAHKRLNPLPIVSLWRSLLHLVSTEVEATWVFLASRSVVSQLGQDLRDRLTAHDHGNCAACSLASLAGDEEVVVVVGAVVLSGLRRRNWGRSKRVYFLEELLLSTGEGVEQQRSEKVGRMFELGEELRRLRKESSGRPVIDEPRRAGSSEALLRQETSMDQAFETPAGDGKEIFEPFCTSRKPVAAPSASTILRGAFSHPAKQASWEFRPETRSSMYAVSPLDRTSSARPNKRVDTNLPATPPPTSISSPPPSRLSFASHTIRISDDVDELFTQPTSPSPKSLPKTTTTKPLPKVWLPRTQYGPESDQQALLNRKPLVKPVLRLGREGKVKGPWDSVSELAGPETGWEEEEVPGWV